MEMNIISAMDTMNHISAMEMEHHPLILTLLMCIVMTHAYHHYFTIRAGSGGARGHRPPSPNSTICTTENFSYSPIIVQMLFSDERSNYLSYLPPVQILLHPCFLLATCTYNASNNHFKVLSPNHQPKLFHQIYFSYAHLHTLRR